MATVNIDGKDYEFESLTDAQKAQIVSLKFVQEEIKRLNGQLAVYKTAEVAYTKALKQEMEE